MLTPLHPGLQPLSYDIIDTQLESLLGGEVVTLTALSRDNTSTETATADVLDGYDYDPLVPLRPGVALATAAVMPNYLADAGKANYFTMLGTMVGSKAGLTISGGTNFGPHTALASGKVTCWDKPGQYVVTVDALAATFVSSLTTGLTPGTVIGHNSTGKLQHSTNNGAVAATGVATFVEFTGSMSLVTTPAYLVGASPSFDRIVIDFNGGFGTRTVAASPS